MQNRYSGDVGDFGKFGLLRYLLNNDTFIKEIEVLTNVRVSSRKSEKPKKNIE